MDMTKDTQIKGLDFHQTYVHTEDTVTGFTYFLAMLDVLFAFKTEVEKRTRIELFCFWY